jgi:hypothetical protein
MPFSQHPKAVYADLVDRELIAIERDPITGL